MNLDTRQCPQERRSQVAERLGAPIVKALLGEECVPDDSSYTTGGTGIVGTRPSQEVFANCEALLIVGSFRRRRRRKLVVGAAAFAGLVALAAAR